MMNQFVISQYYLFTITLFAFYIGNAHSFPNVPGKQFEQCFRFSLVVEYPQTVEHLGLALEDSKHICALKDMQGKFCFVVTPSVAGNVESECHEFDLLDLRITLFEYPLSVIDIIVFRNGNKRWDLMCKLLDYDDVKEFYSFVKYNSRERNLTELGSAIDLKKRGDKYLSGYETYATKPSIYIDESDANASVVHVVDSRGPVLILLQDTFVIHTAEGKKVFASSRRYTAERYFFTCASSSDARQLSSDLAKYTHHGYAIPRTNPVFVYFI